MRRSCGSLEVPLHLRNAPTRLMKELGYGKDYRYAHDEPDAYAAGETYFPEGMPPREYYRPVPRGLEIKIAEALEREEGSGARNGEVANSGRSDRLRSDPQSRPSCSIPNCCAPIPPPSPPTSRVVASRSTSRA